MPDTLQGLNWTSDVQSAEACEIEFFGARGKKHTGSWSISASGSLGWMKIFPTRASAKLTSILNEAAENGKAGEIALISVSPSQAVVLYLEGVLTPEALEKSTEAIDSIIAEIVLEGVIRKILISPDSTNAVGLIDNHGEPL